MPESSASGTTSSSDAGTRWVCEAVDEMAMVSLGQHAGEALSAPFLIELHGDLGMGKTTFTRGILRAFGHTGAVKSPTYTLVEPYAFEHFTLYHFDLYRLGDPEELEYMGIRDYFDSDAIMVVEWADRGRGFLPAPDVVIAINQQGAGRQLIFEAGSGRGIEWIELLQVTASALNTQDSDE